MRKFAEYNNDIKKHVMVAPLIGQLGKNYSADSNKLITGDELLKSVMASLNSGGARWIKMRKSAENTWFSLLNI